MLKNKVQRLQKDFLQLYPKAVNASVSGKYTFKDWTMKDVRAVLFPEGRGICNSKNESLCKKWDETDWNGSEYLPFLTVPELKQLRDWLEEREKGGLSNVKA